MTHKLLLSGPEPLVNSEATVSLWMEQEIPMGEGGNRGFKMYKDVEVSNGTITFNAESDIEVNFNLVGTASDDVSESTAIVTGSNIIEDLSSTEIITPNVNMGHILITGMDGVAASDNKIAYTTLTIDFGVGGKTAQRQLASNDALGITRGSMVPVITATLYVTDSFKAIMNAAQKAGEFGFKIGPLGTTANKKYEIFFPKCELVTSTLDTAESGPALHNITIWPKFSTSDFLYSDSKGTVQVTRYVA